MRQICLSVSYCCVKKFLFWGFVVIKMVKRCWFEMIKNMKNSSVYSRCDLLFNF